jgi:hypothetical protein
MASDTAQDAACASGFVVYIVVPCWHEIMSAPTSSCMRTWMGPTTCRISPPCLKFIDVWCMPINFFFRDYPNGALPPANCPCHPWSCLKRHRQRSLDETRVKS